MLKNDELEAIARAQGCVIRALAKRLENADQSLQSLVAAESSEFTKDRRDRFAGQGIELFNKELTTLMKGL